MAASLALIVSEPNIDEPVSAVEEKWKVSFSRFVIYPSLSSSCPSLVLLPINRRHRPGTWISSHSPTATIQLHKYPSTSDSILTVCFRGEILEEHYVSKLHFTWPQVSCHSGYPPRGSRCVFVSYRDSSDEIQKFAVRFSVISEAEAFINALKDILKISAENELVNTDIRSEISLESMCMPTDRISSRTCDEESSVMIPVQTSFYQPQIPFGLNCEVEQDMRIEETLPNHNHGDNSSDLPPSFTSFLSNFCSDAQQGAAQPSSSQDVDLKCQIARYMEDSSFQEMLIKVDKVISEIGDDLML